MIFISCSSNPDGPEEKTNPIRAVFPRIFSTNQNMNISLTWTYTGSSTPGLVYELYFGTAPTPPFLVDSLTDTTYTPDISDANTTYYWRIAAKDNSGRLDLSPIFSFTTGQSFIFPLKVGNGWTYSHRYYNINIDVSPPEYVDNFDDTTFGTAAVGIIDRDTLNETIPVFVFHTTETTNLQTTEGDTWLNNGATGLFVYLQDNAGLVSPAKAAASKISYLWQGHRFANLPELFVSLHDGDVTLLPAATPTDTLDPPIKSLFYPITIDRQWLYRYSGDPYRQDRKTIAWLDIDSPVGTFDGVEIQTLFDANSDGNWDTRLDERSYFAAEGLIRRTTIVRDVEVSVQGIPEPIGTIDVVEEYILTSLTR